jgi:hypothetical protein
MKKRGEKPRVGKQPFFPSHGLGVSQRLLLFRDHRALGSHFGVEFDEAFPFRRNVVFMENCLDRAFSDAGLAIDALFGMDVKHFVPGVETLHRADNHTICIAATDARLGDNVSHGDTNLSYKYRNPFDRSIGPDGPANSTKTGRTPRNPGMVGATFGGVKQPDFP